MANSVEKEISELKNEVKNLAKEIKEARIAYAKLMNKYISERTLSDERHDQLVREIWGPKEFEKHDETVPD